MDCKGIKRIIPDYITHAASEDDVQKVEEHLCICQECRDYLSRLLDKKDSQSKAEEKLSSPPSYKEIPEKLSPRTENIAQNSTQHDLFTYIIVGIGMLIVLGLLILLFKPL